LPLFDLGDSLVEPAGIDVEQRLDPDDVHRGEVAHQGAGVLDELLPDVRFASHRSARRKTAA
jgi:hypothetical protein